MSKLRGKLNKAKESSQALKNVGIIGQFVLDVGLVAQFATKDVKPKTFTPYNDDEDETITRERAIKLADDIIGETGQKIMPCLAVMPVEGTLLTGNFKPNFHFSGGANEARLETLKRQADFTIDHLDDAVEGGKKFWAHIQWVRLPESEQYGGDFTLKDDAAQNELTILVTYIPNKKDALALLNDLREGKVTVDSIAADAGVIRGFDEAWKVQQNKTSKSDVPEITLTAIGPITTDNHVNLKAFLSEETINFLTGAYKKNGQDVEKTAEECGTNAGDLAIAMGNTAYFTDLMAQTGKDEWEALVTTAGNTDTQLSDLEALLNIVEPAF